MSEVNDLIKENLKRFSAEHEIYELAIRAIESAEDGLSESSIAEHLEGVARQLIRNKGNKE